MRRYWAVAGVTFAAFTVVFVAVEAAGVSLLTDPRSAMDGGGWAAGAIGVSLLAVDALLPVPSSVVMVLHGALYGAVAGAALSLAGRIAAAAVGFALGRRGGPAVDRYVGAGERLRSQELLDRWGVLGIVASRPVPLVAETVMVLAGAARMPWGAALAAAVAGSLPEVVVYALAGSVAASFGNTAAIFLSLLAVVAVAWVVVERRARVRA
ncbi:MAG TPA: VTT domain-containing protein [Actinomycetota bacterium]|nr:VTT domain-containing protein [Actinomycetota bacterium]